MLRWTLSDCQMISRLRHNQISRTDLSPHLQAWYVDYVNEAIPVNRNSIVNPWPNSIRCHVTLWRETNLSCSSESFSYRMTVRHDYSVIGFTSRLTVRPSAGLHQTRKLSSGLVDII